MIEKRKRVPVTGSDGERDESLWILADDLLSWGSVLKCGQREWN